MIAMTSSKKTRPRSSAADTPPSPRQCMRHWWRHNREKRLLFSSPNFGTIRPTFCVIDDVITLRRTACRSPIGRTGLPRVRLISYWGLKTGLPRKGSSNPGILGVWFFLERDLMLECFACNPIDLHIPGQPGDPLMCPPEDGTSSGLPGLDRLDLR